MNLTVITRTVLGFSIVMALLSILYGMFFYSQKYSINSYNEATEVLVPIMDKSYQLAILLKNANNDVFQHINIANDKKRKDNENKFKISVEKYTNLSVILQQSILNDDRINALFTQANAKVHQAFSLGKVQIETDNRLIKIREIFRSELQNYSARWLTLVDESDVAKLMARSLGLIENFSVSIIVNDLNIAETTLGSVSNITDVKLLKKIKKDLSKNSDKIATRIEKLIPMVPNAADKLKPFYDYLNFSIKNEQGYLSLKIKLLELENKSKKNITKINLLTNSSDEIFKEISKDIGVLVINKNKEVAHSSKSNIWMTSILFIVAIIVSIVIVITQIGTIRIPLKSITDVLSVISDGDLSKNINLKNKDEFSDIAFGINKLATKLGKLLSELMQSSSTLYRSAEEAIDVTLKSEKMLKNQNTQIISVATAITQMESTVYEVAQNAESSLSDILVIRKLSSSGKIQMDTSNESISELNLGIKVAVEAMNKMKNESINIESILEVIIGIAEQTNLLALNAAIEAARAGEQGRGFAVVADEVRNLANKTQESIKEIYSMIESLQNVSSTSVEVMNRNSEIVKEVIDKSTKASSLLNDISNSIESVASMSEQIASAAQEQSHVSKEITENIVAISSFSEEISQITHSNKQTFNKLMSQSKSQIKMTNKFKV